MPEAKTVRLFEILLVLLAIAYAIFSAWAAFSALQLWIGTLWAIPSIITLALFLRGLGIPVVAAFGAVQVWTWPWWLAVPVFLPALPILILLTPLAALRKLNHAS